MKNFQKEIYWQSGYVDKLSACHAGGPGFKSRIGNYFSFILFAIFMKVNKDLFFGILYGKCSKNVEKFNKKEE